MGRGNRILIDRVREERPLFGDQSQEIYRGTLPMSAVRMRPLVKKEEPAISEAVSGIALPGMEKPQTSYGFNRFNELKSTQVKRYYEEVMQDHNSIRYCGFEAALNFSQSSEMPVHVEPSKRLLLRRNTVNDQIEFFL